MTSGQTMLDHRRPVRRAGRERFGSPLHLVGLVLAAVVAAAFGLGGCAAKTDRLVAPRVHTAPYDGAAGDVLWGVVPLRNETGTTAADTEAISDKVVAAAAQVRGVRTVPLNRTIQAMRALGMTEPASPADVRALAKEMGVDGLIVGSVTAFDPYNPPTLGLALALYGRDGAMNRPDGALDVDSLRHQPTDYRHFPASNFRDAPLSVVSPHLDGKNHQVLMDVRTYAEGRHDATSALRWRRYLASMDLFSEFAAWHAVGRLIDQEWIRLAQTPAREE